MHSESLMHSVGLRRLLIAVTLWVCVMKETRPLAGQEPPAPAKAAAPAAAEKLPHPFPRRAPAPALSGDAGWLNTTGPLDLKDLRGKFVILDFWTYCCINCMHILPQLKKLEHAYPNNLVVIGVHSAKFDEEKDLENIRAAILRYEIEHPVVNDPEHRIWDRYFINSWPSLRVIDPEGNLVAVHSGEVDFEDLDGFLKNALPYYRENKLLDEKPLSFNVEAEKAARTPLRFPGKLLADSAGKRLFIADGTHNRIVVTDLDGKLLEIIGHGAAGQTDGDYATARFDHPQGMALHRDRLYVADTENHLLRVVDLKAKRVRTLAGVGKQVRNSWPGLPDGGEGGLILPELPERYVGPPLKTGMASPWDVLIHGDALFIAMAGSHQIWRMPLDESEIGPYAGNGREHITDGPLLPKRPYESGYSAFAQPSGLATDGKSLFIADCEGSAVRAIPLDGKGESTTLVGTPNVRSALFNFGDIDGDYEKARLQHCIGVAYDGKTIYVADTYNNKIKTIDPTAKTVATLAGTGKPGKTDGATAEFDEPAGLSFADGKLYIADTNNHLIRVLDVATKTTRTLTIAGLQPPVKVAAPVAAADPKKKPTFRNPTAVTLPAVNAVVKEGRIQLEVQLTLPAGWKPNPLTPSVYYVEATGDKGPLDRTALNATGRNQESPDKFLISLPASATTGEETLTVSLNYYYCQGGPEGECRTGSVVWTVPLKLSAAGEATVALPLTVKE